MTGANLEGQYRKLILKARFDPVWFAHEMLRLRALPGEPTLLDDPNNSWELDHWQIEMLEASADVVRRAYGRKSKFNHHSNMVSVAACQGPGKTFGAALLMHWYGFCFEGLQVCTAPKLQQVTTRLFREFEKIRQRAVPGYQELMEVSSTKIRWLDQPRWMAIAETGRSPESLQGFHDKYLLIIADEASGIDEEMFPVMRGAMSTGHVTLALLIGNPTQTHGTFAESHRNAALAKDFYRMQVSYENSRRVSRKWVDQMERQYGRNSPVFKIRCLGQFSEASEGQLISPEWIAASRMQDFDVDKGDGSLPKLRISVDVADGGVDETVVTVARHYYSKMVVLKMVRASFEPAVAVIEAAELVERLWHAWGGDAKNGDSIVVDSLGVGAGTAGYLLKKDLPVLLYKGGEASANPQRFRNRRVQSYLALRDDFREQRIVLAEGMLDTSYDWTDLEAQLCSIRTVPGVERVEDLVTKDQMKADGIKSPDMADSLAMQYVTYSPGYLPERSAITDAGAVEVVESNLWSDF